MRSAFSICNSSLRCWPGLQHAYRAIQEAREIKAAGIEEVIVTYFEGNRLSRIRQCGNEGCSLFFAGATNNPKRRSCSVACFDHAFARRHRKDQAP